MALAERTESVPKGTGHACSLGAVYVQLEDNDAELAALNLILYGEGVHTRGKSQSQVWDDLHGEGFDVAEQTINRHRAKNCRCFRLPPFKFCGDCKRDLPHCICEQS